MDTTTLIILAVLIACCAIPMLFMGRKSKQGERPGGKDDVH
jgi:hypothetical protein